MPRLPTSKRGVEDMTSQPNIRYRSRGTESSRNFPLTCLCRQVVFYYTIRALLIKEAMWMQL